MVGIRIEHDVVGAPVPVGAIVVIIWGHAEVRPAEPEAVPRPTLDPVDIAAADSAREVPVLPGMVNLVVRIIPVRRMTHPLTVARMNVRRVRMSGLIAVSRPVRVVRSLAGRPSGSAGRGGFGR